MAMLARRTLIQASAAGVIVVIALIVLASVLNRIFGDVGGSLDKGQLGLSSPTSSTQSSPGGTGTVVKPVRATVFSPGGEADAPDQAGLAIDGNPATMWPTDTYSDAAPFPAFKSGVGLILQLPQPTVLSAVTVDVTSTGTAIQIRSARSATPSSLQDTTELSPPTPMKPGPNTIAINNAATTSYVLVWISTLGTVDGKSRADISEITLKAAS